MVDIETTGTRPDRHAILQIAAVRFDPVNLTIDSTNMFNACMFMPPWRSWEDSTRRWWAQQNRQVFERIMAAAERPGPVIGRFVDWVNADLDDGKDRWFWAKNAQFDFQFLASYHNDFDQPFPFHYRNLNDVKGFIRARCYPGPMPEVEAVQTDQAHDALYDCITQIDWLFKALAATS